MTELMNKKIEQGRQYRDMEIRIVGDSEEQYVVEGYASTFNQPYMLWRDGDYEVWEQIDRKAFDRCDMSDVIFQYNHEGKVYARNSNGTLSVNPDDSGLHITAFLGGTEIGRQLFEEIKGGYTNKMSFGFVVDEDKREITEGEEGTKILRTILNVSKLYDVSAVSLPANPATGISARNYGEGVIEEVKQELLKAEEERAKAERQKQKIRILCEVNNGI